MVIFFHGYCATPQINFCVQAKDLYRRGYDVLLVYQRGHGKSGGAHTTMGLNERYDVKPWVEWAKSRPGEPRIVLYGTSMGASTVAYSSVLLEETSGVKGMVLDSIYLTPHQQIYHECVVRRIPAKRFMMPMIRCLMPHRRHIRELFHA